MTIVYNYNYNYTVLVGGQENIFDNDTPIQNNYIIDKQI